MKNKVSWGLMAGISVGAVLFVSSHLNKYDERQEVLKSSAVIDFSSSGRTDPNLPGEDYFEWKIGEDLDVRMARERAKQVEVVPDPNMSRVYKLDTSSKGYVLKTSAEKNDTDFDIMRSGEYEKRLERERGD